MSVHFWTVEEEEKLINLWTTTRLTYEQIGSALGRSFDSVEHRIRQLRKAGKLGYRNSNKIKNQYEKDLTNVKRLTPNGAFFITSVLCDGHLRTRKVEFVFGKRDCVEFRAIICHILNITPILNIYWFKARPINWKKWKRKRRQFGYAGKFVVYSIELAEQLAYTYGVPMGRKSGIIRLPRRIMKSADPKLHSAVLRAAYETEGGVSRHERGLSMNINNTSILFLQDIAEILDKYSIENNIYGISLRISSLESLLKFYELAYGVFDLDFFVTHKKTGLEELIKRKTKKRPYNRTGRFLKS